MNQQPSGGTAISMFTGVKVFSATMAHDREIVQTVVTQSSDQAFHCLAITVFFSEKPEGA